MTEYDRQTRIQRGPAVGPKGGKPPVIKIGWDDVTGAWDAGAPAAKALSAIKVGNRMSAGAEWAGIGERALYTWLSRGRENEPSADTDRLDIPEKHRPYVDFFRACANAEAHAEVELVTLWRSAAKEDWRAARDLLSRRFPKIWRERTGVELTGADGGPLTVAAVSDPDLARAIAADPRARQLANDLLAIVAPNAPPSRAVDGEEAEPVDLSDLEPVEAELVADVEAHDLGDDDHVSLRGEEQAFDDDDDDDDPRWTP